MILIIILVYIYIYIYRVRFLFWALGGGGAQFKKKAVEPFKNGSFRDEIVMVNLHDSDECLKHNAIFFGMDLLHVLLIFVISFGPR